jgi:phage tail-like protein
MADDPKKAYPLPAFHFQVIWGGTRIGFTEVSGLDFETKVIEYREGSSPVFSKSKQPGLTEYPNITLKRGIFYGDLQLFVEWKKTKMFQEGKEKFRRDVTISLLNEEHKPVISWSAANAWLAKITSPTLNAATSEIAIETMELAHEGLTIVEAK